MTIFEIRRKIRPILLSIGFSAIGFAVAFLLKEMLHFEINRLEISIIAFIVTTLSVLFLFPLVFKIPFGKVKIRDFINMVGIYKSDQLPSFLLIGVIASIITLTAMMLASYLTGKYEPVLSSITLTQVVFSLTPGIWEEVLFRGVIMVILLKMTKSLKKAAIIQIILFGLAHIKGFELIDLVDAFSVALLAVSFTYMTYKTQSLIPSIVFHYLHDTFLFFVQLPDDQYNGFDDNALFYTFFWMGILLTIVITKKLCERFHIKGSYTIYGIEGQKEKDSIRPNKGEKKEKSNKKNKKILLVNAIGFSVIFFVSFEESTLFIVIFYLLFVLANLLLLIFLKKIERSMALLINLLSAVAAFVTAYDWRINGSETAYYFMIGIGFLYIVIGFFKNRKAENESTG